MTATATTGAVSACTRTRVKSAANNGALREATSTPASVAATITATGTLGKRSLPAMPSATPANMIGKM